MNDAQGRLRDRIDEMVRELAGELLKAAFDTARQVVQREVAVAPRGGAARSTGLAALSATPARAAAVTTIRKRRPGERRDGASIEALLGQIEKFVSENPGQGITQIGEGLKLPTADLKLPVQKLVEGKRLRRTGQKRGTKYFTRDTKAA